MSGSSHREKFPLHYSVWMDENDKLEEFLSHRKYDIEQTDIFGRTPLMLAVKLNKDACANSLMAYGAKVYEVYRSHWSLEQEVLSTLNYSLIKNIFARYDAQHNEYFYKLAIETINLLSSCQDLYFEIELDFSTWLPTISSICPSNICRIWRKGSILRIDLNLIGFKGTNPQIKGNMSYILSIHDNEVQFYEINHSTLQIYLHKSNLIQNALARGAGGSSFDDSSELDSLISKRLSLPSYVTYINNKDLSFSKSKTGSFVWSKHMTEQINKHNCSVFNAKDIQITTMKRFEHIELDNNISIPEIIFNPNQLKPETYFDEIDGLNPSSRDIGRTKKIVMKVKTFKLQLWMTDEISDDLQKQIYTVIKFMAEFNPIFSKINYFLKSKLPGGFPLKMDIPLYAVLYGSFKFGNFYGEDGKAKGVSYSSESNLSPHSSGSSNKPLISTNTPGNPDQKCFIDDSIFKIPQNYIVTNEYSQSHYGCLHEQDFDFQHAMMQLLEEYGRPDHLVNRQFSLSDHKVATTNNDGIIDEDDVMIQDAIVASLSSGLCKNGDLPDGLSEDDKRKVMEYRRQQEEDELAKALELSKLEK